MITTGPRQGKVSIHETSIGVWEERVNDVEFNTVVFQPLLRFMRKRGWTIGPDKKVLKHWPSISASCKEGAKDVLRAKLNIAGRCIKVDMWSEDWPSDNPNGHQYCFGKRAKMPFLTGLKCDRELKAIQAWLAARHGYQTEDDFSLRPGKMTALERIQADYDKSWHRDPVLGRPPVTNKGMDETSRDGDLIEHGQIAWHRGRDGRVRRGRVYYNINSMWWFVTEPHDRHNISCREILTRQPLELRRQVATRKRREVLERLINRAAAADDFAKAEKLRSVLFGKTPLYRIWSNKHGGSYWGPCHCGYDSVAGAGRYTRDEAQKLINGNPDQLEARPIGNAPPIKPEVTATRARAA